MSESRAKACVSASRRDPSHELHQDIEVSRQITLWGAIPIGADSQYGAHAFSKEVLPVCQTATELAETENELIETEGCLSSGGMNRWAAALAARELGLGRALSRVRPMPEPLIATPIIRLNAPETASLSPVQPQILGNRGINASFWPFPARLVCR